MVTPECCAARERIEALAAIGAAPTGRNAEYIVNIPIVFNCTGNLSQANDPNLTDFQLEKQVEQLNLDFQALNHDYTSKCPSNMLNVRAGDIRINFYIQDIRRRYTSVLGSDFHSFRNHYRLGNTESYKYSAYYAWASDSGGLEARQARTAMNVWCCYYSNTGTPSLDDAPSSGYAYFPRDYVIEDDVPTQGIVMQSIAIGSVGHPAPVAVWGQEFATGRVLTHEVGHYLGLYHAWGNAPWTAPCGPNGSCSDPLASCYDGTCRVCGRDNQCPDLPESLGAFTYDTRVTPPAMFNRGCGNEPYNNHMHYGVGVYQSAFTPEQARVMRNAFLYPSHQSVGTAVRPMDCNRLRGMKFGTGTASRAYKGSGLIWSADSTPLPPDPDPPSPPAGSTVLSVAPAGWKTIDATWVPGAPPSGYTISAYQGQFRLTSGAADSWQAFSIFLANTSAEIANLQAGEDYQFRVRPVFQNSQGTTQDGEWSNIASAVAPGADAQRFAVVNYQSGAISIGTAKDSTIALDGSAPSISPWPTFMTSAATLTEELLCVGRYVGSGARVVVMRKTTGGFSQLSVPSPPGGQDINAVYGAAFSPDTNLLALRDDGFFGAGLTLYARSGATLTKLAAPSVRPASRGRVAFSPDGAMLVCSNEGNRGGYVSSVPNVLAYSVSGNSLTYIGTPAGVSARVFGGPVAWHPSGDLVAVGGGNVVEVYRRQANTLTRWTTAAMDGVSGVTGLSFSPDGAHLAVCGVGSGTGGILPNLCKVFLVNRTTESLVSLYIPPPSDNTYGDASYSRDGVFLVFANFSSGGVGFEIYRRRGFQYDRYTPWSGAPASVLGATFIPTAVPGSP